MTAAVQVHAVARIMTREGDVCSEGDKGVEGGEGVALLETVYS